MAVVLGVAVAWELGALCCRPTKLRMKRHEDNQASARSRNINSRLVPSGSPVRGRWGLISGAVVCVDHIDQCSLCVTLSLSRCASKYEFNIHHETCLIDYMGDHFRLSHNNHGRKFYQQAH